MQYLICKKGCCSLQIQPYKCTSTYKSKNSYRKAGVFIYDPNKDKVLLVQSKGNLWGIPKGSLKYGETERICAIREVKEETGIITSEKNFSKAMVIRNRAVYYYMEKDECSVEVQNIPNNDANAIGWINTQCLEQLIVDGNITLTQHCRMVFKKFLNKEFPHSTFITVKNKRHF
jgi:ADP-ribose pyrophosphatase YjhB (NUDIX family)